MSIERFRNIVPKIDLILKRGLSQGLGVEGKQVCVEAAICEALGLPHGDDPKCVSPAVRSFKIRLNDSNWPSPKKRAEGLRDLAIAQLGSDQIDSGEFSRRLAEKTIRFLIPRLFREVFPNNQRCLDAALLCEQKGTADAARAARAAACAAADAAACAAADAAANAAYADAAYLNLSAQLALEVLREMNAPGIALLSE